MSDNNFQIVLSGEILGDKDKAAVIVHFAHAFKLSQEAAEKVFADAPIAIKGDLDEGTASQYVAALNKMGVGADYRAQKTAVSAPAHSEDGLQDPRNQDKPDSFKGMEYQIDAKPDFAFLTVQIPADETLMVEASAMATMDTHLKMKSKIKGGLGRFLSGENIVINEFTADSMTGEIGIAPATPGDLQHYYVDGDPIYLQNSAFVASCKGVTVESKWQGLTKGFFSGENLFLIRCTGKGDLWFNTYGAILEIDVEDGYVVDTGNIVAFTHGLDYKISKVGGYKSLFFSGEGFVCRFSGKGKVWIQTRSPQAFTHWAHFYRPVKKSN